MRRIRNTQAEPRGCHAGRRPSAFEEPRPTRRAIVPLACALAVPLAAQERVELPAADKFRAPAFEKLYRVGGMDGRDREAFGFVSEAGFDGAGHLHVLDESNAREGCGSRAPATW